MTEELKNIVIIGATSLIAEHCTKLWAKNNQLENIILVGRTKLKLEALANDLSIRCPQTKISVIEIDFSNTKAIQETVDAICNNHRVDLVLIAHGALTNQIECQTNLDKILDAILVNASSHVLFAEAFASHMEKNNHGKLVIIGSVAGDRGRKSNYVYGAAKGFVTRYVQGLQHRLATTNVKVILVKPGPTDTPMTADLKSKGLALAPVEQVAKEIVKGVDKNTLLIYAPFKWQIIMLIIRHLPYFIFKKLDI